MEGNLESTPSTGSAQNTQPSASIPAPIQIPSGFFSSTLKLEDGNYALWKGQILAAIIAGGYEDFIYATTHPPEQFLDTQLQTISPAYKLWQQTDKSVMSFLFSSLTSEPLSQVVCCNSSHEVWESLRQRFESTSTTRVINLRMQMQQVRKEGKPMQHYLNTVKLFADQLSAIGEPVKYRDYLWYLLEGLPAEYDPIVTAVYTRADQPSIEEVHQLLLNFDLRLEKRHVPDSVLPQVQFTLASSDAGTNQPRPSFYQPRQIKSSPPQRPIKPEPFPPETTVQQVHRKM